MLYDTIGSTYRTRRVPDPRIAAVILRAIGGSDSIVNVGAGAGSYEPSGRSVIAVEPSMTMIRQRPPDSAPAIQATAECLPLRDKCVSAAMAILTLHHWSDVTSGLRELVRVSRDRVVILTYDPHWSGFWLRDEYFPAIAAADRRQFPTFDAIERVLGNVAVHAVPIPKDCVDGFLGAYWARPYSYLDREVRSGISGFATLANIDEGLARLRHDLATGRWQQMYGKIADRDELDVGYRLVVADVQ